MNERWQWLRIIQLELQRERPDSVEKSLCVFSYQNFYWTSRSSICVLNLIWLFLPKPNRHHHSERPRYPPFLWFPEHFWICRAQWSVLPLRENDSHPGLISFWSQRNQFGSPLISDSTISSPHLCLNVSGRLIVGQTDIWLTSFWALDVFLWLKIKITSSKIPAASCGKEDNCAYSS